MGLEYIFSMIFIMIDVVIQRSHNPKKSMMQSSTVIRLFHLGLVVMRTIQLIRMIRGSKTTLKDMVMKIGVEVMLNLLLG